MAASSKALIKSIMIFGGAQIITVIAAILRNKVAAITVGATGVGLSAIYLAISQLMANLSNLGLSDSGVQTISKLYSEDSQNERGIYSPKLMRGVTILRTWEVITSLASLILMIVFAPLLCKIYFGSTSSHFHSMLLLALVPPSIIINGIETAILKSLHATRKLVRVIIASAIVSVLISTPLYIYMGWDGIIFSLVAIMVISAMISFLTSFSLCPAMPELRLIRFRGQLWNESSQMVLLGLSLVITGIASMSAELITQTYLSTIASLTLVGLYKAGYQLSITYPCMIFTAVNNDYYPRLSALGHNTEERNLLVSHQIKALLTVVIPCIAVFAVLLPVIIRLLLSSEFLDIIPMVRIGCVAVIIRCISIPICFIPLALGNRRNYIQMEICSYVFFVVCVIAGCHYDGLTGIGVGIVISNIFDLVYGYILAKRKFDLKLFLRK